MDGGFDAHITTTGGTASKLYFAIIGDTRPPIINDNANYPTGVITTIYQAIEGMQPKPQFVVTTGDYMFAGPTSLNGAVQLAKYNTARALYSGLVFPALGNHECTGLTLINCRPDDTTNKNLAAYREAMLQPIGKTEYYYALDINDSAGQWTSKFLFTSCNTWDATQETWLSQQLARATTFTFVVRHNTLGVPAPCTSKMDALLKAKPYTMLLAGHSHTFSHTGNQLIEGVGGAPITGNAVYGYATVEQLSNGFRVTQYDSAHRSVVATYTVP